MDASVDSSEIPAGYFSTFSIVDPNSPAPESLVRAQKRNRRVFVCIPCHRRKLKCDKLLPCSRCVAAGIAGDCSYQLPPSPSDGTRKRGNKKASSGGKVAKDAGNATLEFKSESSPRLTLSSPSGSSLLLPRSLSSTATGTMMAERAVLPSVSKVTSPIRRASYPSTDGGDHSEDGNDDDNDDDWESAEHDLFGHSDASVSGGSSNNNNNSPLDGASHWARIACEFKEAVPYLLGTEPQWQQRYRQLKSLKCLFSSLDDNINFPFSYTNPASKDQILSSLPLNHIVDTLVTNYLDSFGATHCLFHPPQLHREIQQFYEAPADVSDAWLAQLCMVLALGAETTSDFVFSGSGRSAADWGSMFLNAAQASFGRSSYMVAPVLSTVRTLCMMTLAKLIEASASGGSCSRSGGGYTPLVSLMAMTMRIATSLQLHRSATASNSVTTPTASTPRTDEIGSGTGIAAGVTSGFDAVAAEDIASEMKRRIWVTVRLLDLGTAIRTGTPTLHTCASGDAEPPQPFLKAGVPIADHEYTNIYNTPGCFSNIVVGDGMESCYLNTEFSCDDPKHMTTDAMGEPFRGDPDGLYQSKLARFLPLLGSVINGANSPTKLKLSRRRLEVLDKRIHKALQAIGAAILQHQNQKYQQHQQRRPSAFDALLTSQIQRATIQYQHIEALTHRVLLALHHDAFSQALASPLGTEPAFRTSTASSFSKMSQAAVVESSLALLHIHKMWATSLSDSGGRCPSTCTNLTTTGTATAASVDTPFLILHQSVGGGGGGGTSAISMPGMIKSTAAEMILQQQQQQQQQHPISQSGRTSPAMFTGGSTEVAMVTGIATSPRPPAQGLPTPQMPNTGWLLDLCHDDFGTALIYMVLVLRATYYQHGSSVVGLEIQVDGDGGFDTFATTTPTTATAAASAFWPLGQILGDKEVEAVTAVRHSYRTMRDRSYRSVAHFKEFLGMAILFACFRGLRSGDTFSQVVDATNDVEQVVVAGRRYLLWAADSFTAPDDVLMGFHGGSLLAYAGI